LQQVGFLQAQPRAFRHADDLLIEEGRVLLHEGAVAHGSGERLLRPHTIGRTQPGHRQVTVLPDEIPRRLAELPPDLAVRAGEAVCGKGGGVNQSRCSSAKRQVAALSPVLRGP
jgi:hypothetical protein